MSRTVVVLGSFVADVSFRLGRLPRWGETVMGDGFALGPGGKGSNQAVAAARAGAAVRMISRLGSDEAGGPDAFARLALSVWREAGVDAGLVSYGATPTGAAAILVDGARGENAIVVTPGACFTLQPEDAERQAGAIRAAAALLVQLELPISTVHRGMEIARDAGVTTILNPAPAPTAGLPGEMLALADFVIPNESEAGALTGLPVTNVVEAVEAARVLIGRGAGNAVVTLGKRGSVLVQADGTVVQVPAFSAGRVTDTTGAGDAFCGAFAAALVNGRSVADAARFASAAAGISVTRAGTAPAMATGDEIEQLLR